MEKPKETPECKHKWSHIEDYHYFCSLCRTAADLCPECGTVEKDYGGNVGKICPKCNGMCG